MATGQINLLCHQGCFRQMGSVWITQWTLSGDASSRPLEFRPRRGRPASDGDRALIEPRADDENMPFCCSKHCITVCTYSDILSRNCGFLPSQQYTRRPKNPCFVAQRATMVPILFAYLLKATHFGAKLLFYSKRTLVGGWKAPEGGK